MDAANKGKISLNVDDDDDDERDDESEEDEGILDLPGSDEVPPSGRLQFRPRAPAMRFFAAAEVFGCMSRCFP